MYVTSNSLNNKVLDVYYLHISGSCDFSTLINMWTL